MQKKGNRIESWRGEKTGTGPEPELIPGEVSTTAEACIYADDNSASEEAYTVNDLKTKTEVMLKKIFCHMKTSRLLVNSDKTKIMLMATYQKRTKNDLRFHVDVDGLPIKEVESARLLGVEVSNNFSWEKQVSETMSECGKRLNGLYRIQRQVNMEQKKKLAEGTIISRLRYALEVISSGSEATTNRLESMQSKVARYVLGRSRREWSRSGGYAELN